MIFVTLGTQDMSFERLLLEIEHLIREGVIQEKVIVQAGYTKTKSDYMEIFTYINMQEFQTYIEDSTLIITHGGVGAILTAIESNKKVIAVPRLSKYNEHENDHQKEIVSEFDKLGYIIGCKSVSDLSSAYEKVKSFVPQKFQSNKKSFCEKLIQDIEG